MHAWVVKVSASSSDLLLCASVVSVPCTTLTSYSGKWKVIQMCSKHQGMLYWFHNYAGLKLSVTVLCSFKKWKTMFLYSMDFYFLIFLIQMVTRQLVTTRSKLYQVPSLPLKHLNGVMSHGLPKKGPALTMTYKTFAHKGCICTFINAL